MMFLRAPMESLLGLCCKPSSSAAASFFLPRRLRRSSSLPYRLHLLAPPRKSRLFLRDFIASLSSSSSSRLPAEARGGDAGIPPLRIYNTMTRAKEEFKSKVEGKVGMYVCGVTAYDFSHIGHARVYVTFDVLCRYLKNLTYEVCYVRNFTDVDDKIIARANELEEDAINLSKRYCEEFHVDMLHLHCLPPSYEPRVSDHIPQIIDMIKEILDKGCAYRIDGDVYFSVDSFPEYGRLSGRKLEDNRAGERVAVDSRKKNPADFALWKSAKKGEPFWESPWGPGRPGWHIECSAMSAAYLGHSFDIHGGGMDLVFPHHENEIAQSCAACKESHVSYWVHNGFVTVDSEKMSKSLGNFFTIRQVIDLYHPLALRLFLMGTHYRSPINYSDLLLESASDRLYYIYQTLHDCEDVVNQHAAVIHGDDVPPDTLICISNFENAFFESMSDDLLTPVVLAALSDPLKNINDLVHTRKGKQQQKRIESLAALERSIRHILNVLGLLPSSYIEVLRQLREKALKRANLSEVQVRQKIEERTEARMSKDYGKSDAIRKELAEAGVTLMDSPDGTTWRPSIPLAMQCIGQLITVLKNNGVISFASIPPYYGSVINFFVNFQLCSYSGSTTVAQSQNYFNTEANIYSGRKVLVSFSSTSVAGGLTPNNGFFTAYSNLQRQKKLNGIFMWPADDSMVLGFRYRYETKAHIALAVSR